MKYTREINDNVMLQYMILFTLTEADRHVTHKQLTGLILDNFNIEFADFQIALTNLIETGHIRSFAIDELTTVYELLPKGKEANSFFERNIPIYIREPIKEIIPRFFREEEERRSVKAELLPINREEFSVKCGVYDRNTPLMELTVYAGTRENANKMLKYYNENTEKIYKSVIETMTDCGKIWEE